MVDVAQLTSQLEDKLVSYRIKNREKTSYYDGSHKPRNVGFSVPPKMRRQAPRLGWAGIVVDALEERIQFQGWADPSETLGLDKVYQENRLDVEAGLGHLDALTFGTGFVTVGRGVGGEPDPLVTVTSTMDTTGVWDGRTRRLSSAFTMNPHVDGQLDSGLLYLPDATLTVVKDGGQWRVASNGTDNHGLGRVPVVMLPNRTSASMLLGRSEI
ncbi:MAG: phage portal protein, partial [Propionibacteriaceae bacterium]|nr:phage portal protein [Propionibacteriaceae bacterium]